MPQIVFRARAIIVSHCRLDVEGVIGDMHILEREHAFETRTVPVIGLEVALECWRYSSRSGVCSDNMMHKKNERKNQEFVRRWPIKWYERVVVWGYEQSTQEVSSPQEWYDLANEVVFLFLMSRVSNVYQTR